MKALGQLLSPLGRAISRHPYACALLCVIVAALSAVLHWGHMLAVFTCAASMIVMWKDEMDHPPLVLEDPAAG